MARNETAAYGPNPWSTDPLLPPVPRSSLRDEHASYGKNGSSHVTQTQYYAYSLFEREGVFNTLHHAGLLFQEYLYPLPMSLTQRLSRPLPVIARPADDDGVIVKAMRPVPVTQKQQDRIILPTEALVKEAQLERANGVRNPKRTKTI
ncbi:hypothetical protein L202_04374 [Cryptococcus amylolentus CBS 6039]|uniref:Uncharacterized protein n=2 Tax=Cryptococcus amylolentus TaxID=104669 RepID=A0A1E3HR40_9TREE|nr:hypothetical protein L202_04374 [Cryptococcus amylolentus CBS 6039]ODN78828.1 hypothetical protein L202_04374 [Cryptococcus amylolentus CBS 6039]ODO06687.1 hypothetical protein I350_04045 [Cryptococcus amylolentus CBS 6273]